MDLTTEFGFWAGASLPIGLALCLFLTGLFFAKPLNRMKLLTLPDFYRLKYGRVTEVISSLIMVLSFSFLLAGNLVAGGYLFQALLSTSYIAGVLIIATIVFIYTVAGGLFAVAYTDAIQVFVAGIGSLGLLAYISFNFGLTIPEGMGPFAWEQLTDPGAGAAINWATLLALGLGDIVAIDFMERVFAADSPQTAQRACFVGSVGTIAIGVPFSLVALSSGKILEQAGIAANGPILYTLLQNVVPLGLAIMILAGIVAASLSTADGAILGTSSVLAQNVFSVRHDSEGNRGDKLLTMTRLMAIPITLLGVFFALRVPQTGILLLLAFDIGFAGLLVPLAGGLYWPKATRWGALACIISGTTTRLLFFMFMPTMFGMDNTLLYIPNNILTDTFDGFPTLMSPLVGMLVFIVVSNLTQESKSSARQTEEQVA